MSRRLTEDERVFISDCFLNKKLTGKRIIQEFKDKFEWKPSASVINKYQNYLERREEEEEEEEEEVTEEDKGLSVRKKDTRKQPELIDFSDWEISEENIGKLSKVTGKSKKKIFDALKKGRRKGYTKVDLKTGDLKK